VLDAFAFLAAAGSVETCARAVALKQCTPSSAARQPAGRNGEIANPSNTAWAGLQICTRDPGSAFDLIFLFPWKLTVQAHVQLKNVDSWLTEQPQIGGLRELCDQAV
jgi:hypothetical protein